LQNELLYTFEEKGKFHKDVIYYNDGEEAIFFIFMDDK